MAMSVHKRGGRWHFTKTIDGVRYRGALKTARTKAQAQEAEIKILNQIHEGTYRRPTYAAAVAVNGWPRGRIEVWAAFQTVLGTDAQQPAEVISRYGALGEKLQGNNVTKAGSMKRVEVTETLALRR
jgi:hypothetical protein